MPTPITGKPHYDVLNPVIQQSIKRTIAHLDSCGYSTEEIQQRISCILPCSRIDIIKYQLRRKPVPITPYHKMSQFKKNALASKIRTLQANGSTLEDIRREHGHLIGVEKIKEILREAAPEEPKSAPASEALETVRVGAQLTATLSKEQREFLQAFVDKSSIPFKNTAHVLRYIIHQSTGAPIKASERMDLQHEKYILDCLKAGYTPAQIAVGFNGENITTEDINEYIITNNLAEPTKTPPPFQRG